jgi:DNA modification methylase
MVVVWTLQDYNVGEKQMAQVLYRTRNQLKYLLEQDLSFREGKRNLIHNIHAFAAKFPPQLPRYFIESLTAPGETVLDPMVGSGVTIVEAWLLHRNAIGVDLDPLARLISRVRTREYHAGAVIDGGQRVLNNAKTLMQVTYFPQQLLEQYDNATRQFIDYWFTQPIQIELAALVLAMRDEPDDYLRELFQLIFSSVIVTKSGGVSLARDLAHTRPHRVADKAPKSAFTMFSSQLERAVKAIREIESLSKGRAEVIPGDCRSLPLPPDSVDLIVTSPPYANAIDYMRAHKFSLVWLGKDIKALSSLRSQYIGSEKWGNGCQVELPADVERTINLLEQKDASKARVLKKYFYDMELALKEMHRVLRPECAAIVVVGPSTMRGFKIETHNHLASIAAKSGFEIVNNVRRTLDRNRRMMPVGLVRNGDSIIEQRIHEEFVIGLLKT